MQILKIYSIYDCKTETYSNPIFTLTNASMMRSFSEIAKDPTHPIGKYPGDYTLFEIGEWNDSNAHIKIHTAKINIGVALEFIQEDLISSPSKPPSATPEKSPFQMPKMQSKTAK